MKKILIALVILSIPNLLIFAEDRTAAQIYTTACSVCHASGVANAPKAHNEDAWKSRGKDINQLIESSKKGLNAMPPMGTCMDCTDKDLKGVIEYMMSPDK